MEAWISSLFDLNVVTVRISVMPLNLRAFQLFFLWRLRYNTGVVQATAFYILSRPENRLYQCAPGDSQKQIQR
jgi:hypothetical protein